MSIKRRCVLITLRELRLSHHLPNKMCIHIDDNEYDWVKKNADYSVLEKPDFKHNLFPLNL